MLMLREFVGQSWTDKPLAFVKTVTSFIKAGNFLIS
jgi:hypothetical protein